MTRDAVADARSAAIVRGHIATWLLTAERQYDRIASSTDSTNDEVEVNLFVLAVAQLRRACAMGSAYDESGVSAALAVFDARVPDAVATRDVLTHFDDYERGVGRLQRTRRFPTDASQWFENDARSFVLHVGDLDFECGTAMEACRDLAAASLEALS